MTSKIITKTGTLSFKGKKPAMDQEISGEQNAESCSHWSFIISVSYSIRCSIRHSTFRSSHRMCSVKRCSWKFRKIHGKTPVPESFFNKVY